MKIEKIKFQGQDFICVFDPSRKGGAIATIAQYQNGEDSFAHLWSNGDIYRYGRKIGEEEDIIHTGEFIELTPSEAGLTRVRNLIEEITNLKGKI